MLERVGEGHRLILYPPHPNNPDPTPHFACELCHRSGASKAVFNANCLHDPSKSRTRAYRRLEAGKHPHCRHGNDRLFQAGRFLPLHLYVKELTSLGLLREVVHGIPGWDGSLTTSLPAGAAPMEVRDAVSPLD